MGVTRRVVFPALRILIWAVIAVALVKLAFAGSTLGADSDAAHATGTVTEPTVQVTSATVTNTVDVTGSVVADPAVTVKSTGAGTVSKLLVKTGDTVAVGTPLLKVTQEVADPVTTVQPSATSPTADRTGTSDATSIQQTDTTTADVTPAAFHPAESGGVAVARLTAKTTVTTVTATTAGVVTVAVLKDQVVAVGDAVATVGPGTLSVSGQLTADQQYRLVGAPAEATVTLKGGPAPFTCTGLKIGAATTTSGATTSDTTGSDTSAGGSTTGQVTCAVPAGVTAFAGLGADLQITNGTTTGPVVPITAVQGSVQTGNVWVVPSGGGDATERQVGLGLTDGTNVAITQGLAVGDSVLQFTPVASDDDTDCSTPPASPSQAWLKACGG